ncbi:aquaporin-12-like isoform X1 [Phyllostomus hastatus]|uniref:aquaporin-12-like isoform X1 n=1 Tax=Phyllostomus hastatus TaxID=9423 RepID=UPI001E67E833|nr:aquaporin-12-like isoform X1 [Phyllostomus hastatus]
MAGLNVSLSFFVATVALCQAARRASKALLPAGVYASFAREAAGAAQLGACCLELRVLAELGPWAGGFGPDLLLTLLFLLFLAHGATFDGASANPAVALQELLLAEAALPSTLLKLAAQALGVQAARVLTRRYWAWELSDLHVLQNLMDAHCSSALRTTVPLGALAEGACAFFFHLSLLRLRNSPPLCRVPAVALLVTVMAYTEGPHPGWGAGGSADSSGPGPGCVCEGPRAQSPPPRPPAGPLTSAFFNPALAASVTFHCEGHTLLEYAQVYWLGPLTGMALAVLLHRGHLPRLLQRNLLCRQRNKYRTPRGKPATGPEDARTPAEAGRGREPGRRGLGRPALGSG